MTYKDGAKDGKHYWLTPPELYEKLDREFHFDFDPCPYPKPQNFDGLEAEWGNINYVNPPFAAVVGKDGKKKGPTAWAKKALEEFEKGKKVVFLYPINKWIHMMIEAGAEIRNLKDVRWHSTEDGMPGTGTGNWVACFILDPETAKQNKAVDEWRKHRREMQGKPRDEKFEAFLEQERKEVDELIQSWEKNNDK